MLMVGNLYTYLQVMTDLISNMKFAISDLRQGVKWTDNQLQIQDEADHGLQCRRWGCSGGHGVSASTAQILTLLHTDTACNCLQA